MRQIEQINIAYDIQTVADQDSFTAYSFGCKMEVSSLIWNNFWNFLKKKKNILLQNL